MRAPQLGQFEMDVVKGLVLGLQTCKNTFWKGNFMRNPMSKPVLQSDNSIFRNLAIYGCRKMGLISQVSSI